MDISILLARYLGDSPVVYMIAGLSLLILINLALTLVIAAKSDKVDFHLLPDFINPLLQYTVFLIATQALVIGTKGIPYIYEGFLSLQGIAFASVLIKYYASIKGKLSQLGMKIDEQVEKVIDDKLNETVGSQPQNNDGGDEQ